MASIVVHQTFGQRFVIVGMEEQQLPAPEGLRRMGHMEAYDTVKVLVPTYRVFDGLEAVITEVKRMLYDGHGLLKPTDAQVALPMATSGSAMDPVPSPRATFSLLKIDLGYLVRFQCVEGFEAEADALAEKVGVLAEEPKGAAAVQALADALRSLYPLFGRAQGGNVETHAMLDLPEVEAFLRERFAPALAQAVTAEV